MAATAQHFYQDLQRKDETISELTMALHLLNCTTWYHAADHQALKARLEAELHRNNKLHSQVKEIRQKLELEQLEQDRTSADSTFALRRLEEKLEEKSLKYQRLESKVLPLLDTDSVRLKIVQELEQEYSFKHDVLKQTVESLKDTNMKLRKEVEMTKNKLENQKLLYEKQIIRLQGQLSRQHEATDLTLAYEIAVESENRMRKSYQQLRQECQYYKDRYFNVEQKSIQQIADLQKQVRRLKFGK